MCHVVRISPDSHVTPSDPLWCRQLTFNPVQLQTFDIKFDIYPSCFPQYPTTHTVAIFATSTKFTSIALMREDLSRSCKHQQAPAKSSATPTPPKQSKRKSDEVESENTPSQAPPRKSLKTYVKHETHWILDGNVLLQIGSTRFKLHKSRLASESPWFSNLWDKHAGIVLVEPNTCQREIDAVDAVLRNVEKVDDLDLFFLTFVDGPNAAQFAKLLTAMQCGMCVQFNLFFVHSISDMPLTY